MRTRPTTLLAMLLVAGCAGDGGGEPAPGGAVRLEHVVEGTAAWTRARAELTGAAAALPPRERCAFAEAADPGAEWLDVGPTITLSRADGPPVVLERAALGAMLVYGADGLLPALSPSGVPFDVTLAGTDTIAARTWPAAIAVPPPLVPDPFVNEIGFATDQAFTWTPSGADEVIVEIAGTGDASLLCRSADDGEVHVSQALNEQLASSGGAVVYRAIHRTKARLAGHPVWLEGQYVANVPYQ